MSHQQLLQMQLDNNLSSRQMVGIRAAYNRAAPAGTVMHEPQFKKVAVQWNKLLFEQFEPIRLLYEVADGASSQHFRAVFPVKVASLFRQLAAIHKRDIRRVHIACDSGRSFLKVVATIEWVHDPSYTSQIPSNSRRRVIILAIVPTTKESYEILKDVFHRVNFPTDLDFVFIGDLKVLNICLGLSTGSSSNPCPFCEQCLLKSVPMNEQLTTGKPRTYSSICSHADKYEEKTALVDVASCIHYPLVLFRRKPDVHIDQVVGHPGVHYMLTANWIINRIEQLVPQIEEWYTAYHFVRPSYFSGDFEGNQIRFLLRRRQLEQLHDIIADMQPLSDPPLSEWDARPSRSVKRSTVEKYFNVLLTFSAVVRDCFGKKLGEHWPSSISSFKDAILQLGITRIPTKFHIIISHVPQWCDRHNAGLATVTDQWAETIHHDWRMLWDNSYKVKDSDCDKYASQLHRCVAALNARHIPLDPDSFGRGARFEDTNPGGTHEGPYEVSVCH